MSQREQTRLATAAAEELSNAQPHLHGIDSRIRRRQSSIRDVHVAQFETYIVLRAENMHAERGLGGEIYGVGSSGDVVVGEKPPPQSSRYGEKRPWRSKFHLRPSGSKPTP